MSLETLQNDQAEIAQKIQALDPALTTNSELVKLLKFDLFPFIENAVGEMAEMDAAIQDLVDGVEDILHEETAGIVSAPIVGARMIIAKYKAMLPATATDELKAITAWEKMAAEAERTIAEIVVADPDGAVDDDDEEDEDDDQDDEDAEDEE